VVESIRSVADVPVCQEVNARHGNDAERDHTQETADQLGVTQNTVKIRLHRARQALRTLLEHDLVRDASRSRR
jgi:Sigma-70, region 4